MPYHVMAFQPAAASGKDTYVRQNAATTNYGTATGIAVAQSAGADYNALVEFDISSIPSEAECQSAILRLVLDFTAGAVAANVTIYSILSANGDWTELGATWNTKDGSNNWAGGNTGCGTSGTDHSVSSIGSFTVQAADVAGAVYTITLTTAAVQTWFGASNQNYGIVLKSDSASTKAFRSSDNATAGDRPMLTVTYRLPGPTAQENDLAVY